MPYSRYAGSPEDKGTGVSAGACTGTSSSSIAVVTECVPRVGAGPPSPAVMEMEPEGVSPDSVTVSPTFTAGVLSAGESWAEEVAPDDAESLAAPAVKSELEYSTAMETEKVSRDSVSMSSVVLRVDVRVKYSGARYPT